MTPNEQKRAVIDKGRQLGFDQIAIAPTDVSSVHQKTFDAWLEAGHHGEMAYLERRANRAVTLESLLPDVRSVIVCAINYFQPDQQPFPPDAGEVSRYATTRDYHKIITTRLKQLSHFIETTLHGRTRYYVDTGPVFERGHAEHAGLGYVGRNTMLITQQHGSWVFLAEVLTTLPLPPDTNTLKLSCGRCRRCIDRCPTNAIQDNTTIDSRRCIAYLTIENRGPIPTELRTPMGRWLFGCDICQDVCPHNHRAVNARLDDFQQVRIGNRALPLKEILSIRTDDEFRHRFAGTPLMRAKRRGLIRNACVVAGNSGAVELILALEPIARGADAMLQEHAEWAINQLQKAKPSST